MRRIETYFIGVQTGCPHLEAGLRDWHDPATWGGSVPRNGRY